MQKNTFSTEPNVASSDPVRRTSTRLGVKLSRWGMLVSICMVAAILTIGIWCLAFTNFLSAFGGCHTPILKNEHEAAGIGKRYLVQKSSPINTIVLKDWKLLEADDFAQLRWELFLEIYYKGPRTGNRFTMTKGTAIVVVDVCGQVLAEKESTGG
jgi:hypothetical protein